MGGGSSKSKKQPETLAEGQAAVRRASQDTGNGDQKMVASDMFAASSKENLDLGRLRTNSESRDREEVKDNMAKKGEDGKLEEVKKRDVVFQAGSIHLSPRKGEGESPETRSLEITSLILNALNSDQFMLSSAGIFEHARDIERAMQKSEVPVGEYIIKQGDTGNEFFVIESGSAVVEVDGKQVPSTSNKGVLTMERGACFGEVALIFDQPRNASIKAIKGAEGTDVVTCWSLDRQSFKDVMAKCAMHTQRRLTGFLNAAKKAGAWKCDEYAISDMVAAMTSKDFKEGGLLSTKGEVGEYLYCLDKGTIQVEESKEEETSTPGYFVGLELLTANTSTGTFTYNQTVMAGRDVTCYALPARDVRRLLNKQQNNSKGESGDGGGAVVIAAGTELTVEQKREQARARRRAYQKSVNRLELEDCSEVSFLGRGAFGNVTLVQYLGDKLDLDGKSTYSGETDSSSSSSSSSCSSSSSSDSSGGRGKNQKDSVPKQISKEPRRRFALKQMSKAHIVDKMLHHHALNEKRCLESLNHPCILTLYKTFQDRDSIYMLTELCAGPELYHVVQRPDKTQGPNYPAPGLSEKTVQFYAACMLGALQFMDERGVAHRDLKSENVLVHQDGYLKLIDWGFAKHIPYTMVDPHTGEEYVNNKSFTMCGTPEYFAPEMILNVGCTRAIDLWTYGIMVYEMYTGFTPFIDQAEPSNMKQMFVKVLSIDLEGPPFQQDFVNKYPEATDFISRCLRGDASLRAAPHDLMDDPYMRDINWSDLEAKKIVAPWSPAKDYLQTARSSKKKNSIPEYDNNPDYWPEEDQDPFEKF